MAGTMAKEMIDFWNDCSIKSYDDVHSLSTIPHLYQTWRTNGIQDVLARASSTALANSPKFIYLHVANASFPARFFGTPSPSRQVKASRGSIHTQTLAREHGLVEVTVPQQGSALIRP
jgi:hypothetical protein